MGWYLFASLPALAGALEKYRMSAEVSNSHPYPLLNMIKLEAIATGKINLENRTEQLQAAAELREGQARNLPPADVPWCYFDLAELQLFQNDEQGFLGYVEEAIRVADAQQLETFAHALQESLVEKQIDYPGLSEGMRRVREAIQTASASET